MDFLDFRLLRQPTWREPHKSLKSVDFVESAPFPEAILDFQDSALTGKAEPFFVCGPTKGRAVGVHVAV